MMYEEQIFKVEDMLSDVQHATVDYLYHRMYDEGQNRMLVADEVGLGKTWIAKGLVAKAFARWQKCKCRKKKSFNVFYICSNQQLSAQNLKKVNFTKDKRCVVSQVNRISLLAYKPYYDNVEFCIYSLTPDTSFNEASTLGIKEERLMLYAILEKDPEIMKHKVRFGKLMEGFWRLKEGSWQPQHESSSLRKRLRDNFPELYIESLDKSYVDQDSCPECYRHYRLNGKMTLLDFIRTVATRFDRRTDKMWDIYAETIGKLRRTLTDVCLSLMDADIFIMDEFQRYSQLLDTKSSSEQATIAQKVFSQQNAKVLMLSATPFKAFTNKHDEKNNEQHYKELKRVLQFLYEGTDIDWHRYEEARSGIFSRMLSLKNIEDKEPVLNEIQKLKHYVEDVYYRVIVRTEKIIASNDPNAMIVPKEDSPLPVTKQGIEDFLHLDNVFKSIYERRQENAPSPVDYAKSAPYAMSFLRDYKVGEKASGVSIPLSKNAFVNLAEINRYEFPKNGHWPNGKLNLLMKGMRRDSRLLWCPPSMSYYNLDGAFKGQKDFTKTLVFSAWKLVPKMIATLVSYEAEKQSIGMMPKEEGAKYFADKRVASQGDKARKPYRRLNFASELKNMTTLLLAYPSRYIEQITDPLGFINSSKSSRDIIEELYPKQAEQITSFCEIYGNDNDRENTHISWAYPMVNDQAFENSWLNKIENTISKRNTATILTKEYLGELRSILDKKQPQLPAFPRKVSSKEIRKQAKLMVQLSLGSPAICAYRALKRYFDTSNDVLSTAFQIGLAFIDMFNKPESIAIVELQYPHKSLDYWQKVIQYCIDGNIQAVLDEYVFMLLNEYDNPIEMGKSICNVLSMRTTNLKVDDSASFCKKESEENDVRHYLRSHYAAAFGVNAKSNQGSEVRATSIREAFNSPFRPFVLATTSIGQEGLDFHWYCRKIIHWNLPNNPIDFEQREGRINRFRGKVIRQRVADKYISSINGEEKPWDKLFELANKDKELAKFPCDIVPAWHFDSDGVSIERIVPLYQFSQDITRYSEMMKILGLYRLTFGQPRQEELAEALESVLTPDETDKLIIDLCPLRRVKKNKS